MSSRRMVTSVVALVVGVLGCGDTTGSREAVTITIPEAASITQGSTLTLAVTVDRQGGYQGAVEIFPTMLPDGITGSTDTVPAGAVSGSITLTADARATPATNTVVLTAHAGNVRAKGAATVLTVAVRGAYVLQVLPDTFLVPPATSVPGVSTEIATVVSVARTGGFSGDIQITSSGNAGITGVATTVLQLAKATSAGTHSIPVKFVIPADLAAGDYVVEIHASSPGLPEQTTRITIRVNPSTPFLFVTAPPDIRMRPGSSAQATFRVARGGGYAGAITITTTSVPEGITASFTSPAQGSDVATVSVTAREGMPIGVYTFTLSTNQVGDRVATALVRVLVVAPFQIVPVDLADASGVVGAPIAQKPRVRVVDSFNLPVPDATVVFTAVGGGSIQGGTALSDAQGIASPAGWTLGTVAGQRYVVAATMPGTFDTIYIGARALAGPAASMSLFSGNNQTGYAHQWLQSRITVKVADAYGNPTLSPGVSFTPADAASGNVTYVGSPLGTGLYSADWQLGTDSVQHAIARLGNFPPITFTAYATGCSATPYVMGSTVSGVAEDYVDCELLDSGYSGDTYTFTLATQQAFAFTQTLAGEVELVIVDGTRSRVISPFALSQGVSGFTYYILPAGSYTIIASTPWYSMGEYQFTTFPMTAPNVDGCVTPVTISGTVINGRINTNDCPSTAGYNDSYNIYLKQGQTVDLSAQTSSNITLQINGAVSPASPSPSLRFTASAAGLYKVTLTNVTPSVGSIDYLLRIQ